VWRRVLDWVRVPMLVRVRIRVRVAARTGVVRLRERERERAWLDVIQHMITYPGAPRSPDSVGSLLGPNGVTYVAPFEHARLPLRFAQVRLQSCRRHRARLHVFLAWQLLLSMQLIDRHVSALALTSGNKEHFITKLRKRGGPPSDESYVPWNAHQTSDAFSKDLQTVRLLNHHPDNIANQYKHEISSNRLKSTEEEAYQKLLGKYCPTSKS
jgi:hypothetical protein